MTLQIAYSAQGRLIHIPVETGKTYTLSMGNCGLLYRLYKRKVTTHDVSLVTLQDGNAGKPNPYTFTVDSSYQGFITLRLTHSIAGSFVVENLQLEEGSTATTFEPYKLGNKPAVLPKEKINSDMSGAASHVYPYGNVIHVKEDVRLWGYKIQVGTPTGTFDSVIYEWNNGAVGLPIFREVVNASASGVMNLSFRGTLLKAGKKYYIGRNDPNRNNDSTGNAGVYRKTAVPAADFKYITTLGGSQFYSPAIDFPSTWYYTFDLEVESQKNKPAQLFYASESDIVTENGNFVIDTGLKAPNVTAVRSKDYKAVSPNTLVRVTADYRAMTGGSTRIFEYDSQYKFIKSTLASSVVTSPTTAFVMFHAIMAGENVTMSTKFAYAKDKMINKPAILQPVKNFADKQNLVLGSWQGSPLTINTGSNLYRAIPAPIRLKAGTYTVSTRGDVTAAVLTSSGVLFGTNDSLPRSFTLSSDTDVYFHFRKKDSTAWDSSTFPVDTQVLGIQIERGSTATAYEPLKLGNKPAVLYPQKNMLPKMSEWTYTNAAGKVSFPSDYKLVMNGDTAGLYYNQHTAVERGKTYTVSVGKLTANARIAIREVKANGTKVFVSNLIPTQMSYTVTPASDTVKLEVDCTTNGSGIMEFENVQLEEGKTATAFAPYVLGNKPL